MGEEKFYKKKDHKVTIKKYGFINWWGYHMYNYPIFKLIVYILFYLIGLIVGLLLANKLWYILWLQQILDKYNF